MKARGLALLGAGGLLVPGMVVLGQTPPDITTGDIRIGLRTIVNLANYPTPIDLTHANDGSRRLYIATQNGHLFKYETPGVFPERIFNINASIQYGGEKGLLGLAFHPDFAAPGAGGYGRFYTYTSEGKPAAADFTHPELGPLGGDHQSVIREWTLDPADPGPIDPGAGSRVLLRIAQPQGNHNGGSIKFGPDKMLYIAMGDGGGGNDNSGGVNNDTDGHTNGTGNGQDLTNVYGKILRIDPLGTNGKTGQYGVPADNPYAGSTSHDTKMIFASGLRNPFRTGFDRLTGRLYAGDVGQGNREEVNIIEPGRNYGWVYMEGTRVNRTPPSGSGPFAAPVAEYVNRAQAGGEGNAVIGGFVYRGAKVPELYGKYVFGDLAGTSGTGRLFHMDAEGGPIEEFSYFTGTNVGAPSGQLYSFGEDGDGELYAMFTGGTVRILLAQAWGLDGGGSWGTATNWIGPMPDGAGHVANFLTELVTPANAPATITLDGNRTVGTLRFNNTVTNGVNPNSYVIAQGSGGTLRIIGGGGTPASIEVLAGMHTISAPVELTTSSIDVAGDSILSFTNAVGISSSGPQIITKTGQGLVNIGNPLTLTGHALNVAGGTFSSPSALVGGDVTVQPGANLEAGAVGLQKLTIRGSADVELITELAGEPISSSISVQGPDAANPASLRSRGIRADSLSIGHGTVSIKPGGTTEDTTVVGSLNMTEAGSTLDLADNDLVVHAGPGGPTQYAGMLAWLQRARNSPLGRWEGAGLTSSEAAANPLTGLALVLNSHMVDGTPQAIYSTFSGEPVALNDVLVKYTYNGDANLDGVVNADDYFRIDSAFLMGSGQGWRDGDFNYDSAINADDYFLIDSAFLGQGAALVAGAASAISVPEPGALLAGLSPLLLLRRRR